MYYFLIIIINKLFLTKLHSLFRNMEAYFPIRDLKPGVKNIKLVFIVLEIGR